MSSTAASSSLESESDVNSLIPRRKLWWQQRQFSNALLALSGALNIALLIAVLSLARPRSRGDAAMPAAGCAHDEHRTGRYAGPRPADMTAAQQQVYDEINRTRPTGVAGPFGPWLGNPNIAQPAQRLGRVCRLETSLTRRESELAILLTATRHRSSTALRIHRGEAVRAGWAEPAISAIERGERPPGLDRRAAAVHDFAAALLRCSHVDDATYEVARSALGDVAMVELTAILGYYTLVAFTLNAFGIAEPPGAADHH